MRLTIALALSLLTACGGGSGKHEVRIPKGAGGVGFLPLLVMEKYHLIEKYADVTVRWMDLGGPAAMNDALLSSSADFISAGPPAFLTLWDKTRGSANVEGVAAMTSMPMYLNTNSEHLKTLDDISDQDKIAVTSIKVSIPAIIMQMYAKKQYGPAQATRFDKFTVSMAHPDAVVAMLSGSAGISAHFSSPPFHQRERKDPRIRTILTSDDVMGGSTTFTMISTTSKFRQENPQVFAAVLKALEEANRMIVADKNMAADLLVTSEGGGLTKEEIVEVLNDPHVKFTTTPENLIKYAEFMNDSGSIKNRPGSWKDLFFSEIHGVPGELMDTAPLLSVEGVTLRYRTKEHLVTATYRVSFNLYRSDRFVVLGPSGCGKSTLLKAVGGYIKPTEGRITLNGADVTGPGPDRVFVFQEFDQLLPWKTVKENIVFALTASGKLARPEAEERAMHYIAKVNLIEFAASYPHTLSGGMKQRVAIARAMAMEPQILLMDEPFAALDALTRSKMQEELLQLWDGTKFTVLFVTHSISEAIRVGTRILLMSAHPGQVRAEVNSAGADPARIHEILFSEEGTRNR